MVNVMSLYFVLQSVCFACSHSAVIENQGLLAGLVTSIIITIGDSAHDSVQHYIASIC